MPRPRTLLPAHLLAAMTPAPVSPSRLAETLGVSRTTVHRRLTEMVAQHLVVREGEGPRATYRLPAPLELLEAERSSHPAHTRITMPADMAAAAQHALDLYCRVGIGQLEEVSAQPRFGTVTHADGTGYSLAQLDQMDELCLALKFHLTGFEANASMGIYGPNVHPDTLTAWTLQRALRHRLAWDRHPRGSLGVHHDEPLNPDQLPGLLVHSDRRDEDGLPTRYVVEMPQDCARVLGDALHFYMRVSTGDALAIVDMAQAQVLRSRTGAAVAPAALEKGRVLAHALSALLSGVDEGAYNAILGATQTAMLALSKALDAHACDGTEVQGGSPGAPVTVSPVSGSPWAMELAELPPGYLLNLQNGGYRVIAPAGADGYLRDVGHSASLQTALQMARNHAEGQPTRSFGM